MLEENLNYFIPLSITETIDASELSDAELDKLYYDKLDEFNSLSANREICYVLELPNLLNEQVTMLIPNSIQYSNKDKHYLMIYEKYLTKNELNHIKNKYFNHVKEDFKIVYYGGITYENTVKGIINDKRNRLDSKFKN